MKSITPNKNGFGPDEDWDLKTFAPFLEKLYVKQQAKKKKRKKKPK